MALLCVNHWGKQQRGRLPLLMLIEGRTELDAGWLHIENRPCPSLQAPACPGVPVGVSSQNEQQPGCVRDCLLAGLVGDSLRAPEVWLALAVYRLPSPVLPVTTDDGPCPSLPCPRSTLAAWCYTSF